MTSSLAVRLMFLSTAIASLSACGGGGGSGGGGPGSSASFSVAPSALTFTAASIKSAPPPPQALTGTVSGTVSGTLFINVTLGGKVVSVSNVVITGANTGEALIVPAVPALLGPGMHTDTITVRACTTDASCTTGQLAGSPRTVSVTYAINGIRTGIVSLAYTINDTTTAADLSRSIELTGYPANLGWSASSDAPWLKVAASGALSNGSGQLNTSIDSSAADALPNGQYTATVRITPQSAEVLSIPVSLTVDRPEVSSVSPYVAIAGSSREVIIRGRHFPLNPVVTFGGSPAVSVNRISDTEIRATYPGGLAMIKHSVQVGGIDRSRAALAVTTVPAFFAGRLTYGASDFTPQRIVYDAERASIVVVLWNDFNSANNELVRFTYASGTWSTQHNPIHNLTDAALSLDGTEWLMTRYSPISVQHFSATDLTLRTTSTFTDLGGHRSLLAVANDGYAITGGGQPGQTCGLLIRYRIAGPEFVRFADNHFCSPFLAASADGSIVLAGNTDQSGFDRYIASTSVRDTLSLGVGVPLTSTPAFDRHGRRILLNARRIYDSSFGSTFTLLGELPASTKAAALSPDGSLAWTYDTSGQVRAFNLLAAPAAGFFPEVLPATTLLQSPDADSDGRIVMTVSPEGEVLFIAGDDGVVIQPLP